jgi:hypothetical protein
MSDRWVFSLGLALLFVLGAVIGRRLGPEYRSRLRPSIPTVVMVWVFSAAHFTLVVLAAVWSTWHFSLPALVALGGGIALIAVGAAMHLSATYVFDEELDATQCDRHRGAGIALDLGEMEKVLAEVLVGDQVWRFVKVPSELVDGVDVGLLGPG